MCLSNQEVSTTFFGFSIQWVEKETIAKDISITNCRGAFCLTWANNVAYTCLTLKTYSYWSSRWNFDLKIPVRMQINIIIYFQFWYIWRVLQTHFCFRQYNLKHLLVSTILKNYYCWKLQVGCQFIISQNRINTFITILSKYNYGFTLILQRHQ